MRLRLMYWTMREFLLQYLRRDGVYFTLRTIYGLFADSCRRVEVPPCEP